MNLISIFRHWFFGHEPTTRIFRDPFIPEAIYSRCRHCGITIRNWGDCDGWERSSLEYPKDWDEK